MKREETTADDGARRIQYQVSLTARHEKVIRCVKLVLKGLPVGSLLTMREREETIIPEDGIVLHYPEGWRNISTPLAILKTSSSTAVDYYYFRSSDQRVRPKKFVFLPRVEQVNVELIYENLASEPVNTLTVPTWEIGRGVTLPTLFEEQATRAEQAYQLLPWEQRSDVPAWARDIALVATVHCQHWSGYVFNDYDQVLQRLHWMARDIDPRRILLYLPGWEGNN